MQTEMTLCMCEGGDNAEGEEVLDTVEIVVSCTFSGHFLLGGGKSVA